MLNYKAAIQAVDYIVRNGSCQGILNKLAILKLLFFAERYSLRKYAQSITGDQFWAMRLGPVASETYNMISFNTVSAEHLKYTQEILSKDGLYGVKSNGALIMRDDYEDFFEKTNEQTKEYSIIADDQVELNKEFYLGNPFDR